ncbi:MAG: DUF2461 domain-containing protein [Oscillospiraceae bacterium]|nr:DUF2461 domain-containing protein [Oscillospiraceae bacterium]
MLHYCALLEQHNERTWFHENHDMYEAARRDFTELVDLLKYRVAENAAPELAEVLLFVNAKDLLYRIPRDMRIYRNQPPYNPSWRAYLAASRHSVYPVGYFLMIAPGNRSHFGTGAWCPDSKWLRRVRTYISENFDQFSNALEQCGYPLIQDEGTKLKRVPAGFDPDDPAGEYLKYKEWYAIASFDDCELTDYDSFADRIAATVRRMEPLRRFFDGAFSRRAQGLWDTEVEE